MGLLENIEKREKIETFINDTYNAEAAKHAEELGTLQAKIAEITEGINERVVAAAVKEFGPIVKALNKFDDKIKAEILKHKSSVKSSTGCMNVVYTKGRETIDKEKVQKILSEEDFKTCLKIGKPSARIAWKFDKKK